MLISILCCFGHKFGKIHLYRSRCFDLWARIMVVVEQLMYLCLAKLISELLYNSWLRISVCTFFLGFTLPLLISTVKLVKTDIWFIDRVNAFL
jgi:hypothetical protein